MDTESLINICNSLQGLQISRNLKNDERFLNIRDESHVPVRTLEIIELVFNSNIIILSDCHYCPSFLMNIISIGLLAKDSYSLLLKNNYCDIIMNDVTII